ncbi:hypothetical protein J7J58_07820 [candidate division WOR-3 bacterium]|nr:hypothetical protein [candidate division WOR-3 bacterium]
MEILISCPVLRANFVREGLIIPVTTIALNAIDIIELPMDGNCCAATTLLLTQRIFVII